MSDDREQKLSRVALYLATDPHFAWASGRALAPHHPQPRYSHQGYGEIHDDPDYSDLFDEPKGASLGAAYVGPISQAEAFYHRTGKAFPVQAPQGTRIISDAGSRRGEGNPVGIAVTRRRRAIQMGVAALGAVAGLAMIFLWQHRAEILAAIAAVIVMMMPGAESLFSH